MKHLAFVAIAFLFVGASFLTAAPAQTVKESTGVELYKECQLAVRGVTARNLSDAELSDANYCMGYMLGIKDMQSTWNETNKQYNHSELSLICIPQDATVFELMKVVIKYLDDHPTTLHDERGLVVLKALLVNYPCREH
jgi:hypothetical protein